MKKPQDMLDVLGQKTSEGSGKSVPSQNDKGSNATANVEVRQTDGNNRGLDILNSANSSETAANVQTNTKASETNTASGKTDSSKSDNTTTSVDTSTWTPESMMSEIKKLRDENKSTRIKYSEAVEKLKAESDSRITAKEKELEGFIAQAKELESIKAAEADRQRTLEEKLSNRESLVADLKAKLEAEKRAAEDKIRTYEAQVQQYRAESEAQLEVYKQRLNGELAKIPEKYKDIASYIVKGAGDPRDALVALNEAQLRGLFEDKTVVVSHSVPNASTGARSNQDRLDAASKAAKDKMDSSSKIKKGLEAIRSGETNSAFRVR